jgi:hypothetical protein
MRVPVMKAITKPCIFCGVMEMVDVPLDGWERWQAGELIQIALPDLPIDIRELLVTGIHLECWDANLGDDED